MFTDQLKEGVSPDLFARLLWHISRVDKCIMQAFLKQCKSCFQFTNLANCNFSNFSIVSDKIQDPLQDFAKWANSRDLNETPTKSAAHPPPLIEFDPQHLPKEIKVVSEAKGFILTDHYGTPMLFMVRGLVPNDVHVS